MINSRSNCDELLNILPTMEQGLRASINGISEELLNHSFAPTKMTIGQLVVHAMSWPKYFLEETPPWELTKDTCRPCLYPLTTKFIDEVILDGFLAMTDHLKNTDDNLLEIDEQGQKGKGYILYRLQLHTLVHANQIAYLRSMSEPDWDFGSHFGDMATALISLKYHTSKDLSIIGF